MNASLITLLSSLGQAAGLGILIWFTFRSLRTELKVLQKLVSTQEKTLEAMERRVEEAEKVGAIYRKLIDDLPADIDKYRETYRRLKDQLIQELEEANRRKDDKLAELTKTRLDEIQKQEQLLDELPELKDAFKVSFDRLESRLSVLDLFQQGTPLGDVLQVFESYARDRRRGREIPALDSPKDD